MSKITLRIATAIEVRKAHLTNRLAELRDGEAGVDDVPWKMILMIGGAAIAVGILVAVGAYVQAQLAAIPTAPGF
jgi:hypothetical protein